MRAVLGCCSAVWVCVYTAGLQAQCETQGSREDQAKKVFVCLVCLALWWCLIAQRLWWPLHVGVACSDCSSSQTHLRCLNLLLTPRFLLSCTWLLLHLLPVCVCLRCSAASVQQQQLQSTGNQQATAPKVLVSVDEAETTAAQLQRQSSAKKQ